MPIPSSAYRKHLRNQRAARAARERESNDPYEQAREKARELHLPGSVVRFVDALSESHRKLGRSSEKEAKRDGYRREELPVFVGFGGCRKCGSVRCEHQGPREDQSLRGGWPDGQGRGLAELMGCCRRTVTRARRIVEERGVLHVELGGGGRPLEARRDKHGHRGRYHHVGRGGCQKGGTGLANAYWPPGLPNPFPPPPEPPQPPEPGERPRDWVSIRDRFEADRLRAQRERAGQRARGP